MPKTPEELAAEAEAEAEVEMKNQLLPREGLELNEFWCSVASGQAKFSVYHNFF